VGCASHFADQHGPCAARQSIRLRLWLCFGRTTPRSNSKAFRTMEAWNDTGAIFFNWYDTQSLKPLLPSTFVGGQWNLAGHLLTLRPGLLALPITRFWDALL